MVRLGSILPNLSMSALGVRLGEILHRSGTIPLKEKNHSAIEGGSSLPRVEVDRSVKILKGAIEVSLLGVGISAIANSPKATKSAIRHKQKDYPGLEGKLCRIDHIPIFGCSCRAAFNAHRNRALSLAKSGTVRNCAYAAGLGTAETIALASNGTRAGMATRRFALSFRRTSATMARSSSRMCAFTIENRSTNISRQLLMRLECGHLHPDG
jgi:hypothetical protein